MTSVIYSSTWKTARKFSIVSLLMICPSSCCCPWFVPSLWTCATEMFYPGVSKALDGRWLFLTLESILLVVTHDDSDTLLYVEDFEEDLYWPRIGDLGLPLFLELICYLFVELCGGNVAPDFTKASNGYFLLWPCGSTPWLVANYKSNIFLYRQHFPEDPLRLCIAKLSSHLLLELVCFVIVYLAPQRLLMTVIWFSHVDLP